ELYLYRCTAGTETIALGIISRTETVRRKIFRTTVLALNEVPAKNLDMIIEYNGLLIRRGYEQLANSRFAKDLCSANIKWDEIKLSGISESSWAAITRGATPLTVVMDERRCPWAADISEIQG